MNRKASEGAAAGEDTIEGRRGDGGGLGGGALAAEVESGAAHNGGGGVDAGGLLGSVNGSELFKKGEGREKRTAQEGTLAATAAHWSCAWAVATSPRARMMERDFMVSKEV